MEFCENGILYSYRAQYSRISNGPTGHKYQSYVRHRHNLAEKYMAD